MLDFTNARRRFTKSEVHAVNWFDRHGFDVEIAAQTDGGTLFFLSKGGRNALYRLPRIAIDLNESLNQFLDDWEKANA